jgi:uncharacterized protein (DUF1330 family)
MSAYVIVDVVVSDTDRYEEYKRLAGPTVGQYDGRYVVRGGHAENLEGGWEPHRVVVLEFPSVQRAKEWWSSAEYAPAKAIRQAVASSEMIVVEGA